MTFIRKTVALLSLCALAACADGRDNCKPGSSGTMLDLLLLAASLTCAAVVAASDDSEEDTANTAQAPAKPAAAANTVVAPEKEPADPGVQYVLALQSPDPDVSRYWLCRSASQEHKLQAGAFYQLGDLTERRYADPVESYKWYLLAQQHGNAVAARRLEALRDAMTAEQIEAAGQRADSWRPGDCGEQPQATDQPMVRMTQS